MDTQKIIEALQARKNGAIATFETSRPCDTYKNAPAIFKSSTFQMRVGHSYYNQKTTKEAHASGERKQADASELWHEASELGSKFRQHKKSKKIYACGQPLRSLKTVYMTANGREISKADALQFLKASEKRDKQNSEFQAVKLETIKSVK